MSYDNNMLIIVHTRFDLTVSVFLQVKSEYTMPAVESTLKNSTPTQLAVNDNKSNDSKTNQESKHDMTMSASSGNTNNSAAADNNVTEVLKWT